MPQPSSPRGSVGPRRRRLLTLLLVGLVLAMFTGLAAGSRYLFDQTEDRLLRQRTAEAAAALQVSVGQQRAPLEAAARLAEATNGDGQAFAHILQASVGADKSFTSGALFRIGTPTPQVLIDGPISLSDEAASAMLRMASTEPFVIVDLLGGDRRRLGYAVSDGQQPPKFVAYAERTLSVDPHVRRRTDEPFAQLNYAIYLGTEQTASRLLGSSSRDLPLHGRHQEQAADFGDTKLLLVMSPIGNLSGDLFANLWWIVAAAGILVAAGFGVLTYWLLERHDTARSLAEENEHLYDEQRQIAQTLQLSLLPQHLDAPDGISVAARYWPAGSANLIGGDFYDAFKVDDGRWAIAIGDICGKGIEAASLTGLARHTLRDAARHSTSPVEVLEAVHLALRDHSPPTFCTACFGFITPQPDGSDRVELSLGGHPRPLLRRADGAIEAVGCAGSLLGMIEPDLSTTVFDLHQGDLLLLYTDGLTDAPPSQAVSVDDLVAILQASGDVSIDDVAANIRALKRGRRPLGSADDTAVLIVRSDGSEVSTVPSVGTWSSCP